MGPLSDRFGRRPVLLGGLLVFIAASLGCALAPDIWTFLVFRLLQAAVVAGFAVSLAVIRDLSQERETASRIGYITSAYALAPMLGPMLGGLLEELFGWRASFWTFALLGTAVFALCWLDLGETNESPSATIKEQFRTYPELLRSRRFWACALCMAFSTGAFYAFLGGAPLAATTLFAMSPGTLGFSMGTITAGYVLGSFLSGRYASRFPLTTTMIAGRIVACGGLAAGLALLLAGSVHAMTLFGSCMFVGLGNGLTMPSASAGALSVRPRLAGSAAGLSGALTVAGGAAVSSITGAVVTESNAAYALLSVMLLSSLAALFAALYVRLHDSRSGQHA
jgi:Bcr/CflA subfamily drug resistance transporter